MSTSAEYVGASETTWKESSERTEARSSGLEVEVLLRQTKVEDKEADAMSQESRGETKAERISFLFHLVNPNLSQNGKAILATLSTTHHLLYTSSKQSLKCSRKELKMSTDTTAGRDRSNFLFSYAVAWCGSDLYVGLVTAILTDPTCGGATCTVSTQTEGQVAPLSHTGG